MKTLGMPFVILILWVTSWGFAHAQRGSLRQSHFNISKQNLALQGYDPVAYFTQSKAVEGSSKYSWVHLGITYYFSSEANKAVFVKNPVRYEPQFGGWCAYAMGESGEKVEVDPETFKIIDDKLYLFYNFYFTNTLNSWNKNEKELKSKAHNNWAILFK
ncbi:YHS domain-containing (seleno)protein [Cytophagales bacterium LB-30]|uniref:YHS domain-containing (Seleno)protein n=1 Tax=Shiella aurantiaca TaxID=3058365 RepID=A0ABT8F197_9BACT|nr:YHS domain-containing (seleno)protein [Shiella aurantiaca]MDN4164168.1 YHS domain-containing (seleno)protein [Shiella aurantiaca]